MPLGEVGEIWFRGPNLIRGYWNRPEATAETIVDGWLRSGDLGRIDDEGFVYVEDRAKDMVLRAGENVYCAEVEAAIYEHPAVYEAAVFGVPHERLGEEVAVAVLPKPGCELDGRGAAAPTCASTWRPSRCRRWSSSSERRSRATPRARSSSASCATPWRPGWGAAARRREARCSGRRAADRRLAASRFPACWTLTVREELPDGAPADAVPQRLDPGSPGGVVRRPDGARAERRRPPRVGRGRRQGRCRQVGGDLQPGAGAGRWRSALRAGGRGPGRRQPAHAAGRAAPAPHPERLPGRTREGPRRGAGLDRRAGSRPGQRCARHAGDGQSQARPEAEAAAPPASPGRGPRVRRPGRRQLVQRARSLRRRRRARDGGGARAHRHRERLPLPEGRLLPLAARRRSVASTARCSRR